MNFLYHLRTGQYSFIKGTQDFINEHHSELLYNTEIQGQAFDPALKLHTQINNKEANLYLFLDLDLESLHQINIHILLSQPNKEDINHIFTEDTNEITPKTLCEKLISLLKQQ